MNVLMAVGRAYETFLPDNLMDELRSVVELTERNGENIDEDQYSRLLSETGAEVVITGWNSPQLTDQIVSENGQLKYLCNITGGVRGSITRDALASGIIVTNWGALIGKTVAEAALYSMLTCLRKTLQVANHMRVVRGWKDTLPQPVESLFCQTVGLHGFGNIARLLVELLKPFGCDISAYDPYVADEVFEKYGVTRVESLVELYTNNRIVSIHAPKIEETFHNVDASLLARMCDGAILVNNARGNIIDTNALIAELQTGRITASLDVYEEEPLPADSPLRDLDNCHVTPHVAGPTLDRYVDFGRLAIDNIKRYMRGEPLEYTVNLAAFDRMT